MTAFLRFLCVGLAMLCIGTVSRGQITGTKTIPSSSYPTLAVAIDSLNQYGVGTGGVTINFTAATNETAPVGGYRLGSATLNASTSATNKITINGNGNLITGFVGTSTTADGIFYIMGTDYVTINHLNLTDNPTNTTTTKRMEWGYSLVKQKSTAPYDGCQYVIINGCNISLNKTYTNTIGIRAAHSIVATTSVLSTSGTNASSTNSYNQFTGNTISDVTRGISLVGISSSVAVYDKANIIGGSAVNQGNTITVGGATNTSYGTYTQYDSVITISNNNIHIDAAQGNTAVYEVYMSTGVGDLTVTDNLFDVDANTTSAYIYAYYNSSSHRDPGSGLSAASTHTITGNTLTGNNTTATSSYLYGIYESSANSKKLIISNNEIRDINWGNATGYLYLVYDYLTMSPEVHIENNTIYNIQKTGTSGYVYGFYLYNYNTPTGHLYVQNNTVRKVKNNSYVYAYYNYASYTAPPTGYDGQIVKAKYNVTDSIDISASSSAGVYNYWCYNGFDSSESSYNVAKNIQGSNTGTSYIYNYNYGYYGQKSYKCVGNRVENITGNGLYCYNYLGMYASLCDSNIIQNITQGINGSTTGGVLNYLGYYNGEGYTASNNRINNISMAGGYMQTYLGYYGTDAVVKYNAITNVNIGGTGYMYNYIGYNVSNSLQIHHNRMDSITQGTSTTFYPWYGYANASGITDIHDNILSNLTTGSTSISFYPYYLQSAGATAQINFYNNFLTNVNFPSGYNGTNSIGVNLASNGNYNVYHNTIRIPPITGGGTNYGFTGIYYNTSSPLDLRNNIINVNVTPAGTGYTVALRRSGGAAGNSPANFLGTSNGNIYYVPTATNAWLYAEGSSAASMVNKYDLTTDPNFNTPCGLFKSFMGHDQASFTENNLIAASFPGTYVPTGTSYAEKGSVPTGAPAVTTDFAGVTRGAVADIGALEFSGTALDNAPPIISYTPVPVKSYCSGAPTLIATITDNSGVNNNTTTAPRLYYKKSSENNSFGANNSSTNGWKYVEATSVSGSTYTFNFDYTLLTSSVGPGDSITYFIIAQDNATPINAGASVVGFPVCPSGVALGGTNGPTNNSPVPNGFKILSTPVFKAVSFPGSACLSGSTVLTISPVPVGTTVQWQTATLTGTFSNIPGATNTSYTTPVNTTTLRYRALISCGTSVLATTAIDTFIIANPSIISTTGATRCGYGSLTLNATVSPFTTAKWYTTATGGTSFHSGNSYTTPNINSSVTYYLGANTPNASTEMVGIPTSAPYSYTASDGYGLEMRFRNQATNFYSTTVYPYNASGSFEVELRDSNDNPTGYIAGPFTVSGGAGTTPVVLQLNWNNIPAGRYFLVMTNISGSPYLNFEYMNPTLRSYTWPINSPSGNASIIGGRYSTVTYYYTFFYNNIIGADCESSAPRKPVTATITPPPAMTVSSPGSPGICLGTCTTINATSSNSSYVYTWTPGPLAGGSHTVCPTATTTYYATATDPYTGCVDFDSLVLAVNAVPSPPTITPTNPRICEGSSVVLVGNAPPGTSGTGTVGTGTSAVSTYPTPYNAVWTGSRTQYLIKAAEMTAAGIQPGQLTSLAFQSSSTGYYMMNYTVRLANVSMSALPSSISCPAGLTTVHVLTGAFTPPSSGWYTFNFNTSSFNWTGGDLLVDVSHMNCTTCPTTSCVDYGSSPGVFMDKTSYQSAYTAYDDGNCSVNTCAPSGALTGAYSQRPNMRFTFRKPLDINWLNVTGLYKNSGLTNGVTLTDSNSVVYASPTTTTVYRAVTNAQGCISAPSLPDTVFVDPAPVVTIAPAGPQTICSGQPVTLCIPTGSNQTYQWYLNNVAISGANSNCYVAGAAGSYKVTATNIVTGCSATSLPTVLTVNPLPTITATAGGPTTICNGSNVVLTANSSTAIAWQWQVGGVNIPGATSSTYTATTSGNYTVVVTNSVSCSNTSNTIAVTVNTTPSTVTPQGSTSFCTGGSVVLQAPTTGGTFTYQWYNGAGLIAGETNSSYTAITTGVYYVIVTNTATGCSSTSTSIPVTVGAGPNATINPQGAVGGCQGGTITLTAVSQPGLCYQWNLNGAPISGATSATYVASAGGNYTVTVSICATPSCNTTTATATTITLNPPPPAAVTPSNPTPFCQGGSVTLSANTGSGLSYQWKLNGTAISGATSATVSAVSNGAYTVEVTNTVTGCMQTSNSVPVTVYAAPNAAITPATNPTFCQGGSVVMNAATTGISSYRWNLNGTPITGAPGAGSSYTATTTGLYSVTVTNSNGCTATSPAQSVQVNALPNVTTIPTGNAAVCQGYTTVLSAPTGSSLTYQWYNGTTPIANATSNTYATGTAGTYKVKITNSVTGCTATSANIVLVVNTPPSAVVTAGSSTTICQDDSVKLSANTGTGFIYKWKLNGNDIQGLDSTNAVYYAKAAGRYTVAVSNATNCVTLSNSIVITVNPRPAAYITYNSPLEFCEGSAVVLVANPGTGLTYQWYLDGTPLANTSDNNISALSGSYSLKVTNNFGCATTSDALNVTVYPTPVPTIVRTNSTLQTSQPYTSYQWFFNNNPIGGATSDSYVFTQNGAYKVRVVDVNGCEGYSNQFFVNNVGIAQTAAGKSIKVYPNPSTGIVNIDASVKVRVVLRDVTGKSILEAVDVKQIDMSDIANGMYLLYISDLNGQLLRAEKVTKRE